MAPSPFSRQQTPPRRAREIAASDDDGSDSGFSDNSLEDLSALLGAPRSSSAAPRLTSTPQAKRRAAVHRSPLTIVPKHRFDLKALAKDARRDAALQASSARAQEAVREPTAPLPPSSAAGISSSHSVLSDIVRGDNGKDAHKVLRAVQRADPGHQELRYCFFRTDVVAASASKPPPEAMQSPWSLLTAGNQRVREQNLISGLPYNLVGSRRGMPEPVFLWLLEEICAAGSTVARTELCNLIAICPEQIAVLFTPDRLKSIWERIGAEDVSMDRGPISVSKVGDDMYSGRDWAPLLAILALLQEISAALPLETRKFAVQSLLRMAMDKLIITNVDLDYQFEHTFKAIINTIPAEEWDSFCYDTCALLQSNFFSQCIRINALLCLPVSAPRAHDLRRRLAATFLFRDASLARRAPEQAVTLQAVIDRLAGPDFQVGPATEFAELRAAVLVLDMAVDDGSVVAAFPPDADAEAQFNARVDELAARLHDIWRRTNDTGMKLARTEAKSVVEWVQKRVTHTVRTRRKRTQSIFDQPGQQQQQQQQQQTRRDLPRQQEFMKSFFRKKVPSPKPAPRQHEPEPTREPEPEQRPKREPEPEVASEPEEIVLDSIVVRSG